MELPQTVRPSRLSPHFVTGYLFPVVAAAVVAGMVWYLAPMLSDYLPFSTLYLYVLAGIPFIKLLLTERRRHHFVYEFYADRVLIRQGGRTIRQEDVPYEKITDISSVTPPFEGLVNVGDLQLHITGTQKVVDIVGIKHPQQFEDLMLGRHPETQTGHDTVADVEQELRELEDRYDRGELGRADYERNYYYLKGKLDAYREE